VGARHGYRRWLALLCFATIAGFAFSFIAGFTVGRFTALIPLLLTAFAISYGRSGLLQLAAYVAAIAMYVLLAWVIPERVGNWGIHIELPLCLVAYLLGARFPPPYLSPALAGERRGGG
jgi:fucose permease